MFKPELFKGHRILVTGGGTGLGREIAARLLSLGATVCICGRRQSVLDDTARELMEQHGGIVQTVALDLRDADAVDRCIGELWESGPLTGLVNNAAGNFVSRTEDLSPGGFDAIANTVLHGTFYVTQAVGKRWIAQQLKGTVLSIVTTWVRTGSPYVVPSAMAKAGIDAMTKSLATEWGRYGIRLNAIAPGIFPTPGATARLRPGDNPHELETRENPMRRLGQMDELGNLAAFLMADGCAWLSGETIAIDGAYNLARGSYFTQYADWSDEQWVEARTRIKARSEQEKSLRTVPPPAAKP
ncbi:SDR family oxidoreductase [Lacisediminimonas profundi]|uniref:SDR family oxidoreductase n=1 Tax=Lacisediminimonas profundi TaxID=2603856 RepID=UPI00124B0453|nr:SDR family oxidoreductase [Lacisediminimonas profundi]